jgi:hypothetical protein
VGGQAACTAPPSMTTSGKRTDMADGLQDAPRHAGQVVRRVLLRRNIAIHAETAQLVADAVQAALRAGTLSRAATPTPACSPRRLRPPVLTWQARASWRRPQDDGAPGVAGGLLGPGVRPGHPAARAVPARSGRPSRPEGLADQPVCRLRPAERSSARHQSISASARPGFAQSGNFMAGLPWKVGLPRPKQGRWYGSRS